MDMFSQIVSRFFAVKISHCKRIVSKKHHSVSKTVRKKKLLTILLTAPNGRSHWEESTNLSHFLLTSQEEFCFFFHLILQLTVLLTK